MGARSLRNQCTVTVSECSGNAQCFGLDLQPQPSLDLDLIVCHGLDLMATAEFRSRSILMHHAQVFWHCKCPIPQETQSAQALRQCTVAKSRYKLGCGHRSKLHQIIRSRSKLGHVHRSKPWQKIRSRSKYSHGH